MNEGITAAEIAELHPVLYHMAADGSWPSIAEHGLLSTSRLLDLFAVVGDEREALETRYRPESVPIRHPQFGTAWIRDQKPMSDSGLRRALAETSLTPADWYRLLNGKVFFWTTEERLQTMLGASAYRDSYHTVLTVDTAKLLDRHVDRVTLSPLNSGATKPYPHPRGPDTFQRITTFPYRRWRTRRAANRVIVELAVDDGVPDIADLVLDVQRMIYSG